MLSGINITKANTEMMQILVKDFFSIVSTIFRIYRVNFTQSNKHSFKYANILSKIYTN